jgi:hypothetical protein
MSDSDLDRLARQDSDRSTDPLDDPSTTALEYLASLELTDEDLELLLGDAPGLSFADVRQNALALFFRIRQRVAGLICADDDLKESVKKSIAGGMDAGWLSLVAVVGVAPGSVAAGALKPLAGGLVISGVERLCRTPSAMKESKG